MTFTVNEKIVSRYKAEGLSTDYLGTIIIILCSLYEENVELLDVMDDENKTKRMLFLYQHLERRGFIESASEESRINYSLTDKGTAFVKFIQLQDNSISTIEVEPVQIKRSPIQAPQAKKEDEPISAWINSWLEIFPFGKVNGRFLRSDAEICIERMQWFIEKFKYDKETILTATRAYIKDQENSESRHTFTRNANYFIYKGRDNAERISDLATWCHRVVTGELEEHDSNAFDKLV